ncbi:MAG: hypothetical protein ABIY70_26475 [Capsulimonas sp.]|uniref:hypothetical protein n=1 Tax=Capsulimonas sp. TaxID=2494211 RepID=UPI0032659902
MVEDMNKGEGGFGLSWTRGPDNDNFSNAALISDEKGSTSGTNIGASYEEREPTIGSHRGPIQKEGGNSIPSPSVWYRWIAPDDGEYTFHVKDDFMSTVGVMSGESVDKLTVETMAPKPLFPEDRYATLHAVAGTVYSIMVVDWDYYLDGMGPFTLNWMPAPKNNDFAKAALIKGSSGHLAGTNLGASIEKDELIAEFDGKHPDSIGSSVWYQWTAPANASYRFGADGKVHHIVAITSGESVDSLKDETETAPHKAMSKYFATVNAVKGSKYNILVEDYHAEQGAFDFNWDPRPVNDDFGNAILLVGKVMTVEGTNVGSTDETDEPAPVQKPDGTTDAQKKDDDAPAEVPARRSVWYRWTASYSDPTSFTVVGDKFKPAVTVYAGTALNALTPVGMEDSGAGETTARVSFTAAAGSSYYILVDGVEGKTGRFSLSGVSSVNAVK